MMAVLWNDVERAISLSRHHFGRAVELFRRGWDAENEEVSYFASMAFMHAMLAGYTSFETAVKRLLSMLDEPIPSGPDWHSALLKRIAEPSPASSRPALLDSKNLFRTADRLRGFRHIAAHNYEDFDEERAKMAVKAAEVFLAEIDPALARFRAIIDPD